MTLIKLDLDLIESFERYRELSNLIEKVNLNPLF